MVVVASARATGAVLVVDRDISHADCAAPAPAAVDVPVAAAVVPTLP